MILPRNGSGVANALLVAGGILLGAIITLVVHRPDSSVEDQGDQTVADLPRHLALPQDHEEVELSGERMIETALAEPDPRARADALRQAGAAAARKDIREALRLGLSLSSVQDRLEFHRGIFGSWAEIDPQAALDHAHGSFSAGRLQSETIGIAIHKWGSENPREAWVWTEQHLTGPLKERAQTDLMIGWTRRTPKAAAEWLGKSGLISQPVINAVARTWAEQAPLLAADWARTLPIGEARETAEVAVAGEWASQDPESAVDHYEDQLVGNGGLNLAIALTDVWGTTDPAATAAWLESLPVNSNRAEAAGVLASVWGASDMEAAVAWSTRLEDARMRQRVVTHLGTTWGALDPDAALAWLQSLPPTLAADGITGAFYSWAGTNPVTLNEWIADVPADGFSNQARRSLGDVLSGRDPAASMELALGITESSQRSAAAGRFFREWRKTDNEAAVSWIDKRWASLPRGVQERLEIEQARPLVRRE